MFRSVVLVLLLLSSTFSPFAHAEPDESGKVRDAIHEMEWALEPPTHYEGWRRRWETLTHPGAALDLRRSIQNVRRLRYIQADERDPWLRTLMLSSAGLFFITHTSELAIGSTLGSAYSAEFAHSHHAGDAAMAGFFYGLAIPGLYDFGCWLGQALLLSKTTRDPIMGVTRKVEKVLGLRSEPLPHPDKTRSKEAAHELIAKALRENGTPVHLAWKHDDKEPLFFALSTEDGEAVLELKFEVNERDDLVLDSAVVISEAVTRRRAVVSALSPFGWNAKGALRQILKLIQMGQTDLIQHEKTFVDSVDIYDHEVHIGFRHNAVFLKLPSTCPERLAASGM